MPSVELTVQQIDRDGLEATYSSANADGNHFDNQADHRTFLHVKNDDGSDHTVTLTVQETVDGQSVTNPTVTVTAGEERFIGPFPASIYNSSGQVYVEFDAVTSVTVAAIRLPNG